MTNASSHLFYEVGSDLLAKPTALTQLIEGSVVPATIVFCNSPSDTDLVEVLLKKRGVAAKKLIGNVAPQLAEKTIEQLRNKELSTIVVTDIAAKNLDIDEFDQLISYSAPSDMESYQARCTKPEGLTRLKTIATLVGPHDIANFMQIQEASEPKIQSATLPTLEDIQKAKIFRIKNVAVQKNVLAEPKYKTLVETLLNGSEISKDEKAQVVAMLLQSYMEVLPTLQASASREEEYDDEDEGGQPAYNSSRDSRGDNRNNSRNSRRGDRDGRNNRGRQQGGNQRRSPELNEEASLQAMEAQARIKRREHLPPLREARIYIGKGKNAGLDETGLKTLLQSKAELSDADIRRTIVRKDYVFFDVLDEKSDSVIDKLAKEDLLVKKATVISTQRNQPAHSEDESLETAPSLEEIQSQQLA